MLTLRHILETEIGKVNYFFFFSPPPVWFYQKIVMVIHLSIVFTLCIFQFLFLSFEIKISFERKKKKIVIFVEPKAIQSWSKMFIPTMWKIHPLLYYTLEERLVKKKKKNNVKICLRKFKYIREGVHFVYPFSSNLCNRIIHHIP